MRIRREEADRALEILEDYHGRLFAPEDSETRTSIEQIIRIFKSKLFQALLDIHDVYEISVKNGEDPITDQESENHRRLNGLSSKAAATAAGATSDTESVSASDVQQLFSPGKLNELLGAVLQHDKKRQLDHNEQQNPLKALSPKLSTSSSPLPLESIDEAEVSESETSSNFEAHDYYPNGQQLDKLNGSPEIITRQESPSPAPVDNDHPHDKSEPEVKISNGAVNGTSPKSANNQQESAEVICLDAEPSVSRPSSSISMNPAWEYEEVIIDRGPSGLGFSIAGGVDNPHVPDDTSIYITKVIPGGAAAVDGRLHIDDVILKVNDIKLVEVPHSIAVDALKWAGTRVHLFVKRRKPNLPPSASAPANMGGEVLLVELFKTASKGLGFSIAGGIGNQHVQGDNAIYITKVMEKGAAAIDGRLEVGDKLIAVNDVQLDNVTHEQAVGALKSSSDQVLLTVRKPVKSNKNSSTGLSPITATSRQLSNSSSTGSAGIRHSATLNRTSLQSLPVTSENVNFDDRSQTLPMPKHTNHLSQQQNNNNTLARMTKSIEGVDFPDSDSVPRNVRKIVLTKNSSGLGFNIVGGEDGEGIFISFILAGGAADLSQQIFRGDQVLEVNGVDLRGATHEEAAITLKGAGNTVTLLLVYKPDEFRAFEAKIQDLREQQTQIKSQAGANVGTLRPFVKKTLYVRALFDYEPGRDSGLPSRGLMFRFGDILHVTNASDDEWWQARRVLADGRDDAQIGIIPSKRRVERRERARVKSVKFHGSNDYSDGSGKYSSSGALDRKKKNFSFSRKFPFMKSRESSNEDIFGSGSYDNLDSNDNHGQPDRSSISGSNSALEDIREDGVHVLSYEVVVTAEISYVRPVVILGPLKERINDDLISEYPERFGSCVPHTTRARRDGEVDGRDYHFAESREQMEMEIDRGFFIEAGQYRENLYGTSISSVKDLAVGQGKHCILDVSAAAIRRLKIAELLPVAILIRPKSVEQLREWDKRMQEDEARKQFEKAMKIEAEFGELFTAIVSGDTPEEVYAKVKLVIYDNTGSSIWVPAKNQRI